MKQFSDFKIEAPKDGFIGDKIQMKRILNKPIIIHKYKIEPSKFDNGNRLVLQIAFNNELRIIFTSSTVLTRMIEDVKKEDFPFTTTIVADNERYKFT